jgi:hypothetical protein
MSNTIWNPVALVLTVLFAFLILKKPVILGRIISILLLVASIYFLVAMVDEFGEFTTKGAAAYQLLLVGGALFILSLAVILLMVYKYFRGSNIFTAT